MFGYQHAERALALPDVGRMGNPDPISSGSRRQVSVAQQPDSSCYVKSFATAERIAPTVPPTLPRMPCRLL
jgi:hypothetical protein